MTENTVTGRPFKLPAEQRERDRIRMRRTLRAELHDQITYVAWSEAFNFCKVGVTTNLRRRLITLRTGCPDLVIVDTYPVGRDLERFLHRRFEGQRVTGEWFNVSASDIREAVAEYAKKPRQVTS